LDAAGAARFGRELIEQRVPYELGGRGSVKIRADGVDASISFPLQPGDGILETDAPPPSFVFGGSIDMSASADLSGKRVLVLEDDYCLAGDARRALANAGADVAGPYPTEAAPLVALREQRIDAAIVRTASRGVVMPAIYALAGRYPSSPRRAPR
jgi:hypothetical protein